MKRDHEQQEGTKRKVLKMEEGQEGEFSSGSDTEEPGRGRSRKKKAKDGANVDIQVTERRQGTKGRKGCTLPSSCHTTCTYH